MTEYLFPSLIDGLVDGGLAADVAPRDLRVAVDVLRAARKTGTTSELATMADMVRQFSVEVNAAAAPSITRISAQAPEFSGPALSIDIPRSSPMFATRITRKAMTIFAITLLAAGTAAAAAGGALPMFEEESNEAVVETNQDDGTNVVEDGTQESDDDQAGDSSDDESSTPATDAVDENHNGDVDHHGKCTAWTNGAAKSATNPAFAELQTAADEAALSIDEYCAALLGTTDDDDSSNDSDSSDESDDSGDKGKSDEDHGNGNSGNGNAGNGNSGNGNSDDESVNDDSDESDNDESDDHGNSDDEHGNSDEEHGNSGSGNSGKGKGNSKD